MLAVTDDAEVRAALRERLLAEMAAERAAALPASESTLDLYARRLDTVAAAYPRLPAAMAETLQRPLGLDRPIPRPWCCRSCSRSPSAAAKYSRIRTPRPLLVRPRDLAPLDPLEAAGIGLDHAGVHRKALARDQPHLHAPADDALEHLA